MQPFRTDTSQKGDILTGTQSMSTKPRKEAGKPRAETQAGKKGNREERMHSTRI